MSYTDEAIEQGLETIKVYREAAPKSAVVLDIAVDWLRQAKRYRIAVPLIPMDKEVRSVATLEAYAGGLQMPHKFMVFEYEHGGDYDCSTDLTRALATKRLVLCVDMDSENAVSTEGLADFVREESDEGAILIWPITWFDEKKEWEFVPGVAVMPKSQLRQLDQEAAGWRRLERQLQAVLRKVAPDREDGSHHAMLVRYQETMPEICTQLGPEQTDHLVRNSALDAAWTALGALTAMQCRNVVVKEDQSPPSLVLRAEDSHGQPVPVDPFHGRCETDLFGRPVWKQGVTMGVGD